MVFYAGGDSNAQLVTNFNIGVQKGVWGSEHDTAFTERESSVQSGHFIFLACGYKRTTDGPNQNRYKNVETLIKYFVQFNRLVFARVTSNVYHNNTPIWKDGIYPVRFNFEVVNRYENYPLASLMEIFSKENLDVFRRSMIPPVKTRTLDQKHINFDKLGITLVQTEFTDKVVDDLNAMEYETEYFEGNKNKDLQITTKEIQSSAQKQLQFMGPLAWLATSILNTFILKEEKALLKFTTQNS